jgi:hypothetical protein
MTVELVVLHTIGEDLARTSGACIGICLDDHTWEAVKVRKSARHPKPHTQVTNRPDRAAVVSP